MIHIYIWRIWLTGKSAPPTCRETGDNTFYPTSKEMPLIHTKSQQKPPPMVKKPQHSYELDYIRFVLEV